MNKLYCYSSTKRAMQRSSMAAIAMAVAFPVQAQEAQSDGLAEIIVTAEKREENLQSVPVSVTAMTGEALTATGISNVEDLQFFVPGVSITNDSMAIINIRGIGTSAFGVATDPSTTVHYDGVYISRPTTSYQDLFDVERIEVLRGPQGVLFGRNSAGGTLNIISKMPTEDLTGALGLTVGNYEKRSLSGTISGPLGAGVRGRLTLLANQRDGIYRDVVSGRRYQNEDNLAGRLTLAIDASDRLEIVLRADASRDRETGARSVRPFYPQGFIDAGATIPANDKEAALDRLPRYDVDAWGVSSTMNWDGGPVTLRSITALRKSKVVQALDVDSTDLFLRDIEFYERSRSFTQEFQLLNNDADKLRWIVGAFYLNEKGNDEIRIIEPGRRLAIPENNTTNAFALFGQASYELIDRLRLTGGLRYSYEKKDFGYRVLLNGNQVDAGQPKSSWIAWTPKIGIDYDIADDVMAYASATRGFKSGGFQLGDGRPFLPEYVWSYEVGLKSTLLDRRLRANFSAFYYDYTNLQVVEYNNGVASTTNAGKATIKGVEAELMARPFDRLTLTSTIAYLDARYDVYFDDVGASLKGKRLPNAPKWNITLGGEYKASLGGGMLTLRTDISWRDSVFFKPSNNPLFSGNATTLINGRVTWQPASEAWEIALYGRNLTNERYVSYSTIGTDATGVSNPTLPLYIYGEPRQYGLQLRYFF